MRRRLFRLFVIAFAALVLGIGTLPYWFGSALAAAGRSRGLSVGRYERLGYARFALHDVEYRRATVRVTATRVEVDTPFVWLWRQTWKQSAPVNVGEWKVDVERSSTPSAPTVDRGWVWLRALLARIAVQLERWLPRASAGAGAVNWPGGGVTTAGGSWTGREIALRDVVYRSVTADTATVDFGADGVIRVTARAFAGQAGATLESIGSRVQGGLTWWEQPVAVDATFGPRGWLPAAASFNATGWNVPAERVKLGALYTAVRAAGKLEWREDRFVTDISATGEPREGTSAPPLEVKLRGDGDTQAFTIETVRAVLPGLTATLSAPVVFSRTSGLRETPARFSLQGDLAQMPWFTATGAFTADAQVVTTGAGVPTVEFAAEARTVRARDVAIAAAAAKGRLNWPRLEITTGTLEGGEGGQLTWSGGWDFATRELFGGVMAGQLRRASLARWLPAQPTFDRVDVTLAGEGPLAEIRHHGRLEAADVTFAGVNPLALTLEWRGAAANIAELTAQVSAGASVVRATGSAGPLSLTFATLEFRQSDAMRLQLSAPATLHWRPQLRLEPLRLTGPDGSLEMAATAGESGRISVSAFQLPSRWSADFVALPGPPWTVSRLVAEGTWDRGPMIFALTSDVAVDLGEQRTATVAVKARGAADGLVVESLRAMEGEIAVVAATGRVPLTVHPGGGGWVRIDPAGALALEADVAPNAAFWPRLAAVSGVDLRDPRVTARLGGTWQRPEGKATLQAARITLDAKRFARPLPAIDALDVEISGDRTGFTLSRFSLSVEGQAVRAQGRLPLLDESWAELIRQPLLVARRGADVRLEVPDAEVAVFTRFLPAVLAPKGRLQADLHYAQGGFDGFVRLRDAASRPLGPLGVVQEIAAEATLAGRMITLREVKAKSGGQPVTLTGTVELPDAGEPRYNLILRGENLPFVRQTGLLLRGDLDLKLQTAEDAAVRLSGTVRLRDSLFLSDIRSFLPKGGTTARRRPPYFAIETVPINAWQLAVDVVGEKFLRLRTPVFTGLASARFRLGGTLGEPRAIGEATIDEGSIRMPFTSFTVTQGAVRLTEADPYEPAVYVRGAGRRYGYELVMEIDGSATQPEIAFNSSPALDSEQVLLMVMTGAAPTNQLTRSATQRVANVGLFLGQSLLASVGADAAEADRLSVASGEKISRQGRETYDIEYKLSDRWTLTGEYNEFDEYNAGMKWRIFGGRPADKKNDDAKK
ncbi:translocation/assembly module TamB domain-containing protein [Horticoccus sp. 23ND18S-11]|uniref:translocation/assembly module TamB domain-containing protein n=1 Tax=Horticoccus sp. 23ND18S-11 TaxID=3391832 RepID=UPI0039C980B2